MGDVQFIRFSRSGKVWNPTTGAFELTYTFDPRPSTIDKIPSVEWYIRPVGHRLEPSADNRRRQTVKYKVVGSMRVSDYQYSGNPASPGLEDVLLDRSGEYAYAFVSDLEMPNYYDVVAIISATVRQSPKFIEGESWISYTLNLQKIYHRPK